MTGPGQKDSDDLNAATEASPQPAESKDTPAGGTAVSDQINDDSGLEREADVMGAKSVTGNQDLSLRH
jgi:hypothetical protein